MSEPIKILHLLPSLGRGGAEAMLFKLLAKIDRKKFRCSVISMGGKDEHYSGRLRELEVPVHSLGATRLSLALSGPRLIRLARAESPHILQTWLYQADLMGTLIGKVIGVPRIAWNIRCSNANLNGRSILTRSALGLLARLSRTPDAVVVNSEAGRTYHEGLGYCPRRWELIPNGFDTETFAPRPDAGRTLRALIRVSPETPLIGTVARLDANKDYGTLLRAASRLIEGRDDVHFVLVGAGIENQSPELLRLLPGGWPTDRIHLLGERSDIADIMAGLDIFTLASRSEGFANVIGEAMACGAPCVSTEAGDAKGIIGDTGKVVAVSDPEALCTAWMELLDLPREQRREMGARARQRICDRFELSSVVKRYENFYSELASLA